MVSLFNL